MSSPKLLRLNPRGLDLSQPRVIELADIDKILYPALVPIFVAIPYNDTTVSAREETTRILKEGLEKALADFPILIGRVFDTPPQRPYVRQDSATDGDILYVSGLEQVREDIRPYEDIKKAKFHSAMLQTASLIHRMDLLSFQPEGSLASLFQITYIRGAVILACIFNHVVCDASSHEMFVAAWAAHCNPANPAPELPLHDRSILQSTKALSPIEFKEADTWIRTNLVGCFGVFPPPAPPKMLDLVKVVASVPMPKAQAFKASIRAGYPAAANVSVSDCLCAVIWRAFTRCRARQRGVALTSQQQVGFGQTVGFRQRKSCNFPKNFFGNAVALPIARIPLNELVAEDSIPQAASLIRQAIDLVNRDTVAQFADWAAVVNPNPLRKMGIQEPDVLDLFATSWSGLDCYSSKLDFGFGKCEGWVPGDIPIEFVVILPTRRGEDGRMELSICFEREAMDAVWTDETVKSLFERVAV